jgi:hypothetical protein
MNKKIFSICTMIFLAALMVMNAQEKKPKASFASENYDFGKINESNGPVSYKFEFTNIGAEPLVLSNVVASCGCTTPNWPKEPVLPGAKNSITVTYNPQGRPGRFEKSITVTSNADPSTQVLKIMGEVIPKTPTIEDLYPQNIDGLRMKSTQIAFNNIAPAAKGTVTTEVYNSTTAPIKIEFNEIPKFVTIKITPETIQPQGKAMIEATYDAAIKNDWGFVFDRVGVVIDGKPSANKISVSANIQEDFTQLTPEQKQNAPKLEVDNVNFDFDTIKSGDKVTHDYTVKNSGKSDLIIRKLSPSCGCTAVNMKSQVIKPGESTTIVAEFNSAGKSGTQSKTITLISNDPANPKTILWIKGTIQ